jgi:hypothetical protein
MRFSHRRRVVTKIKIFDFSNNHWPTWRTCHRRHNDANFHLSRGLLHVLLSPFTRFAVIILSTSTAASMQPNQAKPFFLSCILCGMTYHRWWENALYHDTTRVRYCYCETSSQPYLLEGYWWNNTWSSFRHRWDPGTRITVYPYLHPTSTLVLKERLND